MNQLVTLLRDSRNMAGVGSNSQMVTANNTPELQMDDADETQDYCLGFD